ERVVDEIRRDALDGDTIRVHDERSAKIRRPNDRDSHANLLGAMHERLDHLADDPLEVDILADKPRLAPASESSDIEHVGDELREPDRLLAKQARELSRALLVVRVIGEHLGEETHRSHRRAKLVRDIGDETRAEPSKPPRAERAQDERPDAEESNEAHREDEGLVGSRAREDGIAVSRAAKVANRKRDQDAAARLHANREDALVVALRRAFKRSIRLAKADGEAAPFPGNGVGFSSVARRAYVLPAESGARKLDGRERESDETARCMLELASDEKRPAIEGDHRPASLDA